MARILIIDDDAMNREILEAFLENEHQIILANNGQNGITSAETIKPDLIILDVKMPDMDGFTVCHTLKTIPHLQHIPVMFITGTDDPDDVIRGQQAGASAFLPRPFEGDMLINVVKSLLNPLSNR